MFSWLAEGGMFMYIILGVSVVAFALILERMYSLTLTYTWNGKFFKSFIQFAKAGDLASAQRMCMETKHPLAKILNQILRNKDGSPESVESAAQVAMQKVLPKVSKRTGFLQMLGNVATLLGLLGTIQGLTVAFSSLAGVSGAEKAELLARGISTAMSTTAFGLIVAIPCVVAFTILSSKENDLLDKYEAVIEELVHVLKHRSRTTMQNGSREYVELDVPVERGVL